VQVLNWYGPKPNPNHCFQLSAVGDFISTNWANDFHDWVSPYLAVFVLPNHVNPPDHSQGTWDLANWYGSAVAWTIVTRPDNIYANISVPVRGALGPVSGCFFNLPMPVHNYRVALYVRNVDGKYYGAKPVRGTLFQLNAEGCFDAPFWYSHPNDPWIPFITAVLLPAGLQPPNIQGDNQVSNNNQQLINNFNSWWMGKIIFFIEVLRSQPSPSITPSFTRTASRTPSQSRSASYTPSVTASITLSPVSPSATPTISLSPTGTLSPVSPSATPSRSASFSVTPTLSASRSVPATVSPAPSPGILIIANLPPIGSGVPITGVVVNVPGFCRFWKILVYVRSNNTGVFQWWGPKPNQNSYTILRDDCSFSIPNWASDPLDFTVPAIGLFLVPVGIPGLPLLAGQSGLYQTLNSNGNSNSYNTLASLFNWAVATYIADRPRLASFGAVSIPPVGSIDPIFGLVNNLHLLGNAADFRILVYVDNPGNGGWWGPKPVPGYAYPLVLSPTDPVPFNLVNWAFAPEDRFVPIVRLFLVRVELVASGRLQLLTVQQQPNLPNQLLSASIADVEIVRPNTV
jgi:hypothetical protein